MAYEFANPHVANLSVGVNVDSDANIATSGATAVGVKKVTMQGFNLTGTLADANTVFDKLFGSIIGASYDSLTANKTLSQGVKEVE